MDNKIPSFRSMYSMDYTFKTAVSMIVGSLLFQVVAYIGFGQIFLPFVAILAVLTLIGAALFIYRYNLITSTFRDGITVTGKVLDLETVVRKDNKGNYRNQYYGKFSYAVQGQPHEIRMRIADNPHLMGLREGGDIDLVLREEKPEIVFIKMLFVNLV